MYKGTETCTKEPRHVQRNRDMYKGTETCIKEPRLKFAYGTGICIWNRNMHKGTEICIKEPNYA
jgi:hypothetical protein